MFKLQLKFINKKNYSSIVVNFYTILRYKYINLKFFLNEQNLALEVDRSLLHCHFFIA